MNISKDDFKITLFQNEKMNISLICYIDKDNQIWFRGRDIALILEYKKPRNAILKYVDIDDKILVNFEINVKSKRPDLGHVEKRMIKSYFINESGFYSLILQSKMEKAKLFKKWVTSEVLPSIRKNGYYQKPVNKNSNLIMTEYDLHTKIVEFIRKKYPDALLIAGLGENQISEKMRLDSYRKGYQKGQADLQIFARTKKFTSLVIEFKSPTGVYKISDKQIETKEKYIRNGAKYLLSNDPIEITSEITDYMNESERYNKRKTR